MILVVGVAVGIAVLVHGNQLPLDQSLDGFLERRLFDAGILNDFLVRGPAVSLTAGAADQIRIQFELPDDGFIISGGKRIIKNICANYVERFEIQGILFVYCVLLATT